MKTWPLTARQAKLGKAGRAMEGLAGASRQHDVSPWGDSGHLLIKPGVSVFREPPPLPDNGTQLVHQGDWCSLSSSLRLVHDFFFPAPSLRQLRPTMVINTGCPKEDYVDTC